MAVTPRPKRVVLGVVAYCSEEDRKSSKWQNWRASMGFYVLVLPPDAHLGIPRNHLNLARIRFHTSSLARSPERPSLRRHLNVKWNKSSNRLHLRMCTPSRGYLTRSIYPTILNYFILRKIIRKSFQSGIKVGLFCILKIAKLYYSSLWEIFIIFRVLF